MIYQSLISGTMCGRFGESSRMALWLQEDFSLTMTLGMVFQIIDLSCSCNLHCTVVDCLPASRNLMTLYYFGPSNDAL